jgi:hypothetical protein
VKSIAQPQSSSNCSFIASVVYDNLECGRGEEKSEAFTELLRVYQQQIVFDFCVSSSTKTSSINRAIMSAAIKMLILLNSLNRAA